MTSVECIFLGICSIVQNDVLWVIRRLKQTGQGARASTVRDWEFQILSDLLTIVLNLSIFCQNHNCYYFKSPLKVIWF